MLTSLTEEQEDPPGVPREPAEAGASFPVHQGPCRISGAVGAPAQPEDCERRGAPAEVSVADERGAQRKLAAGPARRGPEQQKALLNAILGDGCNSPTWQACFPEHSRVFADEGSFSVELRGGAQDLPLSPLRIRECAAAIDSHGSGSPRVPAVSRKDQVSRARSLREAIQAFQGVMKQRQPAAAEKDAPPTPRGAYHPLSLVAAAPESARPPAISVPGPGGRRSVRCMMNDDLRGSLPGLDATFPGESMDSWTTDPFEDLFHISTPTNAALGPVPLTELAEAVTPRLLTPRSILGSPRAIKRPKLSGLKGGAAPLGASDSVQTFELDDTARASLHHFEAGGDSIYAVASPRA